MRKKRVLAIRAAFVAHGVTPTKSRVRRAKKDYIVMRRSK